MASDDDRTRKEIEELHFRLDELVRENHELKRWADPAHLAGVAHGAVMEVHNKLPKDAAALIAAMHEQTAAINRLVEVLSAPTVRTATLNLPSGPASMEVQERRSAPWQRKPA
jgi:hypothetical protein